MKLEIGTYVINDKIYWCSGFLVSKKNTNDWIYIAPYDDRKQFLNKYIDCSSNRAIIGAKGMIVDIAPVSKHFHEDTLLIRWDDGTLCGKPIDALSIDEQRNRDEKLNQLL